MIRTTTDLIITVPHFNDTVTYTFKNTCILTSKKFH